MHESPIVVLNWRDWRHPRAGGAEAYIHGLAKSWAAEGRQVIVVAQRPKGAPAFEISDGVQVIRVGNRWTGYLAAARHVRVLREDHPDLRILESINTIPFLSRLYSASQGILLIHHAAQRELLIETLFPLSLLLWVLERISPWLLRPAHVITISEQSRRELIGIGYDPDRVTVVSPGLDLSHLPERRPVLPLNAHRLCYIGPLKRYKGVLDVVRGFEFLLPDFPEATLDIAGRGYLESELTAIVQNRKLSSAVKLHGYISEDEKFRLLSKSTLFAYPSASEGGWSLSVLEAMAMGVVPIVTPTLAEMAEDGRGLVVPYGEPREIAAAARNYWRNIRLFRQASQHALKWARGHTLQSAAARVGRLLDGNPRTGS